MSDLQDQIDALVRQVKDDRGEIDTLRRRADAAELRADALETQALVDRDMIAELQRDGVLSQEHARQIEDALRSSRTVGAAIGVLMGTRQVSEQEAFNILRTASQNSNRKLRDLAAELVASYGSV